MSINRATQLLIRLRRGGVAITSGYSNNTCCCNPVAFTTTSQYYSSLRFKSTSVPSSRAGDDGIAETASDGCSSVDSTFIRWDGLTNGRRPSLTQVRSLPIIGSLATPSLTGVPSISPLTNGYDFWLGMRNRFGEFYSFGSILTGNPNDIYRTNYVINDPREYMKIIRAGGKYPHGTLENLWVNIRWGKSRGMVTTMAIHGRGEEWRRIRTFLQNDLLHPDAARGYVPGIVHAASRASKGARVVAELQSSGKEKGALNSYLNRCAFDMFSSLMLGIYTETADRTTPTDPENERFVCGAVQGQGTSINMMFSFHELIAGKLLNLETAKMKHCFEGFDTAWAVAQEKVNSFIDRKEKGGLTENERASYLFRALDRRIEEGCDVTLKEVTEIAFANLFAGVDTTSALLSWNLLHLARLPHIQEKLYNEISESVETFGGGQITDEALKKSNVPYLHAFIRETHRLTPNRVQSLLKTVDTDRLELHGRGMDKGDVVTLESYSVGMNPDLVEDPNEFRPERWLKDTVDARKGTASEVIDHPFLADPFSQGARKCPGSRVAKLEVQIYLAQLVLDWKILSPVTDLGDVEYIQKTLIEAQLPDLKFEAR